MADIPEIKNAGSTGEQKDTPGDLIIPDSTNPFQRQPLVETVQGLAATRFRSMGGEAAANLISASFTHFANELAATKSELESTRQTLNSTRAELAQCQAKIGILKERVLSNSDGRHLRNVAMVGGTALLGIAIEFSRNDF